MGYLIRLFYDFYGAPFNLPMQSKVQEACNLWCHRDHPNSAHNDDPVVYASHLQLHVQTAEPRKLQSSQ